MSAAENPMEQIVGRRTGVPVAVDPVALVVTECITVTSAMRKHARWAHSSVSAILGGSGGGARFEALKQSEVKASAAKKDGKLSSDRVDILKDDVGLSSRWGLRGKKGQSMQDNPLLSAFARLRSDLKGCHDIHLVDAPAILHPFLQVIRSSSTSAPITSLALIAITKFFAYGIISHDSLQLPLAMQLLSSAVTHCRFEASDSATDEIVLFRILKLMEGMITGPGGEVLGDESMCEMMETGISMCCQVRLSELLRRAAEVSMVTMCQTIFQRLKHVRVDVEDTLTRIDSRKSEKEAVKMDPSVKGDLLVLPEDGTDFRRTSQSLEQPRDKGGGDVGNINGGSQLDLTQVPELEQIAEIKPYSLPSIRELFRVLVGLLDPHDKQHNDTMRVMALRIVDVALEVAGPSIASHPSLATLAKDTLCRHIFQLVRSENIAILNESLRVAGTLLATCRRVLKLQQELFLSYIVTCLHPRVEIPSEAGIDPALYEGVPNAPRSAKPAASQGGSGRATPVPVRDRQKLGMEGGLRKPDAREAMVESVGALVRTPSFMTELFINYDCEVDRGDLCLDMVGLLSRNAFPDAATWSTTNVPPLCLDALLGYIQSIVERLGDTPISEGYPSKDQLKKQRTQKRIIIEGATKFNESPRAGLAFLEAQGIIDRADNPQTVARFLRGTSRVDKRTTGDFLSKRTHEAYLTAYLETFDFSNLRVDEALRQLLISFRLPGEAPLIERIVSDFSEKYFESAHPPEVADKDGIYILIYAIIMLNTDQHNRNIKNNSRMKFENFANNLRGVNNGKDFDQDFLFEIYESIKTREIILPEEHDNKDAFDHAWKELLIKIQSTSELQLVSTNVFDADMFDATWKPVVATLSYVFMSATDDTVFARVVTGFDQCAQIATKYGLYEALDHIVFCLSSIGSLAAPTLPSTSLNTEVKVQDRDVMVSETAVRFGRDFKAQLATVVLFKVVVGHESAVRGGWLHIIRIILNLFLNSLITTSYASVSSNDDLPPIPLQSPAQVIDRGDRAAEVGLFSAFTSYVSSFANDEPPEPSDQEIEATLCTVDCINACLFEDLFANISQLPLDALESFMQTLLTLIPEDASPRVIVVKPEIPAPTPIRPNGQRQRSMSVAYDPSLVFILEIATILAARDADTISRFGKEVAHALQTVVRDATHMHPLTLSRTVYYLLSFLRASHEYDFVRAPVVLHTISKFEPELLKQAAPYISRGLQLCLNGASSLKKEILNTPDFWDVLKALNTIPENAGDVFKIVLDVVEEQSFAVTADNYEQVMLILNEIATTGSAGAAEEQRRDQAARAGRSVSQKHTPDEVVVRGRRAIQITYQMTSRIPSFIKQSQLEPQEAWSTYWSPPFRTLTTHSLNPCRQIRQQALASLYRVLLSPSLVAGPDNVKEGDAHAQINTLFANVLFPLITQLLKPEIWHSDPGGMGETRQQAAILCCKVFLRFLDTLFDLSFRITAPADQTDIVSFSPTMPTSPVPDEQETQKEKQADVDGPVLWSRILQMMERLVKSGSQNDGLEEALPENLKNIVLVMSNGEYLVPPDPSVSTEDEPLDVQRKDMLKRRLWKITWDRLERVVPGLMEGLFPNTNKDGIIKQAPPDVPEAELPAPVEGGNGDATAETHEEQTLRSTTAISTTTMGEESANTEEVQV